MGNDFSNKEKIAACYNAIINTYLNLRIGITNILLSLSVGLIVAVPQFYKEAPKEIFLVTIGFFVLAIFIGLIINEIDSENLKYLKAKAEGKDLQPFKKISDIFQHLIYLFFILGIIGLIVMSYISKK